MLLNNTWVKWEILRNLKLFWGKWNANYQNVWDAAKAVLRRKFIAFVMYFLFKNSKFSPLKVRESSVNWTQSKQNK